MAKKSLIKFVAVPGAVVALLAIVDRWWPENPIRAAVESKPGPSLVRVAILDDEGQPVGDLKLRDRDGLDWRPIEPGLIELPTALDGTYLTPILESTGRHLYPAALNLKTSVGMPTITIEVDP